MIKKSEKQFLSEQAYQAIKEAVVTCQLGPGQLIVQSELASQYGVGVTPVREALRRLALEGFVISVPRLGYQVSQVTYQDVQEIFEMRLILECSAARLAVERAKPEQIQKIVDSANFTYVFKERDTYMDFLQHNAEFHLAIAGLSENKRLVGQIGKVLDELHRVFHLGLDFRDSAEEMRADHMAVGEALARRDAEAVETLLRKEIDDSRDRISEALKQYQRSKIGLPVFDRDSFLEE